MTSRNHKDNKGGVRSRCKLVYGEESHSQLTNLGLDVNDSLVHIENATLIVCNCQLMGSLLTRNGKSAASLIVCNRQLTAPPLVSYELLLVYQD